MVDAAEAIGAHARRAAFEEFLASGIAGTLAAVSRSHKASLHRKKVGNEKGGKRATWRQRLQDEVLGDRRFMAKVRNQPERPRSDQIIERARQLRIIDVASRNGNPEDMSFVDYETGRSIAANKAALMSEISKIKKRLTEKIHKNQ